MSINAFSDPKSFNVFDKSRSLEIDVEPAGKLYISIESSDNIGRTSDRASIELDAKTVKALVRWLSTHR